MKNIAKNNLSYTGIVTISRYSNNKKIEIAKVHNEGKNPLFDFLADCLVGDYKKASMCLPDKIMLLKKIEEEEGVRHEAASGFIHTLTPPERISDSKESRARYSFLVTADKIERSFDRIGLYTRAATDSKDGIEEYAAICDAPGIDNISRIASASLIIDWELIISNRQ